jgi:20S proteasome alpha/beta subunit
MSVLLSESVIARAVGPVEVSVPPLGAIFSKTGICGGFDDPPVVPVLKKRFSTYTLPAESRAMRDGAGP